MAVPWLIEPTLLHRRCSLVFHRHVPQVKFSRAGPSFANRQPARPEEARPKTWFSPAPDMSAPRWDAFNQRAGTGVPTGGKVRGGSRAWIVSRDPSPGDGGRAGGETRAWPRTWRRPPAA